MKNPEFLLRLLLRWVATVSLLATFAVLMPFSWMDAIHRALGMGPLPDQPIVGYLARSTSAFYAMLGGLLWRLSFNLRRNRLALNYIGTAIILFGLTLFCIDWLEGMPPFWSAAEGPVNVALGVILLWLIRKVRAQGETRSAGSEGEINQNSLMKE